MALVVKDRVKETTTTTGTGALSLAGAVTNFIAFSAALSDGDTTYYAIVDNTNDDFEVGLGTYASAGNTLTRTTVLASSNAGSAVNLSAGTKDVFVTYPADKSVYLDAAGSLVGLTIKTFALSGGTANGTTIGGSIPAAGTFTTANAITVDATNLEVTNLKAKDGTSAGSIADSTGVVTLASSVLTTTDINGGTIDGTTIGGTTQAKGKFVGASAYDDGVTIKSGGSTTASWSRLDITNQNDTGGGVGIIYMDGNGTFALRNDTGTNQKLSFLLGSTEIFAANSSAVIFQKGIEEQQYSLTGTAIDPANGTIQYKTLGANTTFTESLSNGEYVTLMINDGAGYTITWPTTTWVGGSAPTLETSGYNVIELWHVNGTLYGAFVGAA